MYVNTLITLQENLSTYAISGSKGTGHVTLNSPGLIKCYIQGIKKPSSGQTYAFYAFSKAKNKGVRIGDLSESKETKWIVDAKNIDGSGVTLEEIDGVALVAEDDMRGVDTVLMGFKNNRYMIIPIIDEIFKKKHHHHPPHHGGGNPPPPPHHGGGNPPPPPHHGGGKPEPRNEGGSSQSHVIEADKLPVGESPIEMNGYANSTMPAYKVVEEEKEIEEEKAEEKAEEKCRDEVGEQVQEEAQEEMQETQEEAQEEQEEVQGKEEEKQEMQEEEEANKEQQVEEEAQEQAQEQAWEAKRSKEQPKQVDMSGGMKGANSELLKIAEKLKAIEMEKGEGTSSGEKESGIDHAMVARELQRIIGMLRDSQEIQDRTKGIEQQIEKMRHLPHSHKLMPKSNMEQTLESRYMAQQIAGVDEIEADTQILEEDTSPKNALNFIFKAQNKVTSGVLTQEVEEPEVNEADVADEETRETLNFISKIDQKIKEIEARRRQEK